MGLYSPKYFVFSTVFSILGLSLFSQTFVEQAEIILSGESKSSIGWGDYDNDGYLDLFLIGNGITRIYKNNGNSTFSEQIDITPLLTGVHNGSVG